MARIPDIPGTRILPRSKQEKSLRDTVARLCQCNGFPGSQPVSFARSDLLRLESDDFWVCEKSDGIRVLLLVYTEADSSSQSVYLIDRNNKYYQIHGFSFPRHDNPRMPLLNTLVDGELVVQVDPFSNKETLCFPAFDCLVLNDQNIMSQPLTARYGKLKQWFFEPFTRAEKHTRSFEIQIKEMNRSYHVDTVFASIPTLRHGNDGLVYTRVNAPYTPGTNANILKWKPPSEISIDFKLVLRFPPLCGESRTLDSRAKPAFLLHMWCGDRPGSGSGSPRYEEYGELFVEDDEWERMKLSGRRYHGQIVEVQWNAMLGRWRLMRLRDDKQNANYRTVVERNVQIIAEGVDRDSLLERCAAIRLASKARSDSELRFGRLATSKWSRVSGPSELAGMKR
ncbi:mRNA capping enzyme, catalytic domain-containing protein [Roridomyces roridus]|uniref:mRNA guanylyltransferase n=1 Tax=Roridomyces roridus TaxID=1738132 RepID=A0AAD7BNJ0_9AGAR|nr:mRNA capping enzyme, catalytic domain-containing protein [Roridomyces roridus]